VVSQPMISNWMVVWVMWKRSRRAQLMASRIEAEPEMGISPMVTWLARACEAEPSDQTCRSCTSSTPGTELTAARMSASERRAFKQDVQRLADDCGGAPGDHSGDKDREGGVEPECAGGQDARATRDDGGGGERVAQHVQEDGADVDVARGLPEQRGDGAVHQDTGGGDGHHDAGLDGDRRVEAMDGGDGDPCGKDDEGERVDEGRKDAGALVAEGLLVGGGAALEVDGDKGETDGQHVREVVSGLGEQEEEHALHRARVGRDLVHGFEYTRFKPARRYTGDWL